MSMGGNFMASILSTAIPTAAITVASIVPGIFVLDYVHVLLGAVWTGTDVFLGLILSIVMSGMDDILKYCIAKRLLPMILSFIPTASAIVPLAGYELALREGVFRMDPLFISVISISVALVVLSFAFIFRYAIFIYYQEGRSAVKAVSNTIRKVSVVASVQLVLQIVIISLMAYLVVFLN